MTILLKLKKTMANNLQKSYILKKIVEYILYDSNKIINFQPDINNNILSLSFFLILFRFTNTKCYIKC